MIAIKDQEKINIAKCTDSLLKLIDTCDGIDFVKILLNYVAKTSSKQSSLKKIDENIFEDKSKVKDCLKIAINSMIAVAEEEEMFYSTGDLAKYFGVSITAINKWIDNGRFKSVERCEKNKQIKISENTMWKSRNGEYIPIKRIVDEYKEENFTEEEEINAIKKSIKFFEDKYGGTYEKVSKTIKNISPIDESNLREWKYLTSILK